jgi:hypothetical protein
MQQLLLFKIPDIWSFDSSENTTFLMMMMMMHKTH